jgi:tetratricopeptide (TPR) repeat protein
VGAAQAARRERSGDVQIAERLVGAVLHGLGDQPPYPITPAHELYGTILLELKRPAEAARHFAEALRRTPGRPMAVYGIARAAEALGDASTARARYTQFLELWKDADHDRPELAIARRFITAGGGS